MVLYEFQGSGGERIERDYPMGKAPKIGRSITVDGKKYRRIPPSPPPGSMRGVRCTDYTHEAVGMLNERHYGKDPDVPCYSQDGFPVFRTKRQIDEYAAKKRDRGSTLQYDP